MSFSSNNVTKSAFPMLNMMMNMQRLGMQAMSFYHPSPRLFWMQHVWRNATRALLVLRAVVSRTPSSPMASMNEQVIGVGEEVLNVGTRMVAGKTTRVRRVVIESPVQQDVTLHTETVVLEHRQPVLSSGNDVLTEVTVEMSDYNEVPVVSKSVHLVEEVLLRKEITARIETIHDTVRRDTLEIEQPSNLPVVVQATSKTEDRMKDANLPSEIQDKKQSSSQAGSKANDQKRA